MKRKGYMRNGMAADNSYGNSGTAHFLDGGGKLSVNYDAGRGHAFRIGAGYEWRAPMASTAFISPEINNDFVTNLKNERIFSSEVSYQYQNAWMHANLSGYYSRMEDVTEWQNFYNDDENSFTYRTLLQSHALTYAQVNHPSSVTLLLGYSILCPAHTVHLREHDGIEEGILRTGGWLEVQGNFMARLQYPGHHQRG